jgi:hypothetical protein
MLGRVVLALVLFATPALGGAKFHPVGTKPLE